MRRVIRIGSKRKSKSIEQEDAFTGNLNTRIGMIQALIPMGLMAVADIKKCHQITLTSDEGGCMIKTCHSNIFN